MDIYPDLKTTADTVTVKTFKTNSLTVTSRRAANRQNVSSARETKKLTASMPRRYFSLTAVCLLRLFESANDYKDHYRAYACWHDFFAGDEDVHASLLSLCLLA